MRNDDRVTIRGAQFDFDTDTSRQALEILHGRLQEHPEWSGEIRNLQVDVGHTSPAAIAGAIYDGIRQSLERNRRG